MAGGTTVVGLGASIVQGTVSASITDRLRERLGPTWRVVNAGKNGQLAWNAAQRVTDVIAHRPDAVFVLVGSNDVMASLGAREERRYRRLMRLPERPTPVFFRASLVRIVQALAAAGARVLLCTLPFLGEDLDDEVNAKVRAYNDIIREVATEYHAELVDVHAALAAALARTQGSAPPRAFPRGLRVMLQAAARRMLLRWSFDRIARRHGFVLLSDGIHLGETAADIVAGELAAALQSGGHGHAPPSP